MIVITKKIPCGFNETITLKPIFDVHLGSKYCDVDAFKKFLGPVDPNTYYFSGGDLIDSIVVTDKRYDKHGDITTSDAVIDDQIDMAYEILKPYRKQIIAMGNGNHEATVLKRCGTDPTKRISKMLGCPPMGVSGIIKLVLQGDKKSKQSRTIIVRWHHGYGGGTTTRGGLLTKFSREALYWDADLFLFGHVHQRQMDRIPVNRIKGNKVILQPKIIVICGTFLSTHANNTDNTYSENAGYPPVEMNGVDIHITPNKEFADIKVII